MIPLRRMREKAVLGFLLYLVLELYPGSCNLSARNTVCTYPASCRLPFSIPRRIIGYFFVYLAGYSAVESAGYLKCFRSVQNNPYQCDGHGKTCHRDKLSKRMPNNQHPDPRNAPSRNQSPLTPSLSLLPLQLFPARRYPRHILSQQLHSANKLTYLTTPQQKR